MPRDDGEGARAEHEVVEVFVEEERVEAAEVEGGAAHGPIGHAGLEDEGAEDDAGVAEVPGELADVVWEGAGDVPGEAVFAGDGEFADDDEGEIGADLLHVLDELGPEVLGAGAEGDFDLAHGLDDRFDAGCEVAFVALAPHGERLEAEAGGDWIIEGHEDAVFAAEAEAAVGELEGGDGGGFLGGLGFVEGQDAEGFGEEAGAEELGVDVGAFEKGADFAEVVGGEGDGFAEGLGAKGAADAGENAFHEVAEGVEAVHDEFR